MVLSRAVISELQEFCAVIRGEKEVMIQCLQKNATTNNTFLNEIYYQIPNFTKNIQL